MIKSGLFPTGVTLSTKPSKHVSKIGGGHEDSDVSPATKQEIVVSKLPKLTDNVKQHQKNTVNESASSLSKLPTTGQRSSNKVNPPTKLHHSPTRDSSSTSTNEDVDQNRNTDTAVKASDSTGADHVKDSTSDGSSELKSASTEEQEYIQILSKPSMSETKGKEPEATGLEESIAGPITDKVAKPIQNNDASITANVQVEDQTVLKAEAVPSCEVQLPDTDIHSAQTNSLGGQHEATQQTILESSSKSTSPPQSDGPAVRQQTLLSPEVSLESVNDKLCLETPELIRNTKPDLILSEPDSAALAQVTIPAHEDVTDTSAKPFMGDNIHRDIKTHPDQEAVIQGDSPQATNEVTCKGNAIFPAESASEDSKTIQVLSSTLNSTDANVADKVKEHELFEDHKTNVLPEIERLPPTESIKQAEVDETSKEVGRNPADIQTEAVTICELPKNVENQLDKEPLLLAGEREGKDSKPIEKLNDAAVESSDCKEESKASTVEAEAERKVTKPKKSTDLSSEKECLLPDSGEETQTAVALENNKLSPTGNAESRAGEVDTKVESENLEENTKSGNEEIEPAQQQMNESTAKDEPAPKQLLTKDEEVGNKNANQEEKHAHIVEESQTEAASADGKEESGTQDSLMKTSNDTEVSKQENQESAVVEDQDDKKTDAPNAKIAQDGQQLLKDTAATPSAQEETEGQSSQVKTEEETATVIANCEVRDVPEKADAEVCDQKDQKSVSVRNEHLEIKKPETHSDQTADIKAANANQEAKPKTAEAQEKTPGDAKLPVKSNVSATVKPAGQTDKKQDEKKLIKESVKDEVKEPEDQAMKASKVDAKKEPEPVFTNDASSKKDDGKQKDKVSVVSDKIPVSSNTPNKDSGEKRKPDATCLKQELQTEREEKTLNLRDSQKLITPPALKSSSPFPTAAKSFTPPESLQLEKVSPSSWLDVEHREKPKKVTKKRLNASESDDGSQDPDDSEDFIRSIKEGSIPFPRPTKSQRRKKSPSPSFAMPAIKEANFDPEKFQFGLKKNDKNLWDRSPAMVLQRNSATREGRTLEKHGQDNSTSASGDQMESLNEVKAKEGAKGEAGKYTMEPEQNNREEPGKPKSRLERMSILSSLLSSPRSRSSKEEATSDPNSTLSFNKPKDLPSLGKQGAVDSTLPGVAADKQGVKGVDQGAAGSKGTVSESALSPSSPPQPSFSEVKLPDHLEKYLKKKSEPGASQSSTKTTKPKQNLEGSAAMDQASTPNVDVGLKGAAGLLKPRNNIQKPPRNRPSTTKTKVGI